MKQLLTLCMVAMLLSSALFSGQASHCHGNACGAEVEHAMSDHGHDHDHDNDQAQQDSDDADDADDEDGKTAKSQFHGWHAHGMDAAISLSFNNTPSFDLNTAVAVFYTQPLASHVTEPPLKPPSLA